MDTFLRNISVAARLWSGTSVGRLVVLFVILAAPLASVTLVLAGSGSFGGAVIFSDVTGPAGIATAHDAYDPSFFVVTGQAWGDFDGDGWEDLYLTSSESANALYVNDQQGGFVTWPLNASVALTESFSGGALFGDYDNDGWLDLYVLNFGANVLFHNEGGAGFTDVSAVAGVGDVGKGQTAAWGDFDQDGHLDLYVANYACPECSAPSNVEDNRDRLFRSNGNGTFADITSSLGLTTTLGAGFTVSWVDYDNDGDLDIYVVNDYPKGPNGNMLFRNDGPGCGEWCFTDVSVASGANIHLAGMGLAIGDYDHDLDLDFYFSNLGPAVLLQNQTSQGSPTFIEVSNTAGVAYDDVTWGAVFFDYDNDSWQDIYVAAGVPSTGVHTNAVYHNLANGTFADVSATSGANNPGQSIGVAYADYDRDGWVDLVVGNWDEGYFLYHNESVAFAGANNWLSVALTGTAPINRDAIGSRVYIATNGGETLMQEVKAGSSHGAGNEMTLHFGLGSWTISDLWVVWPNGHEYHYGAVAANQFLGIDYPGLGPLTHRLLMPIMLRP